MPDRRFRFLGSLCAQGLLVIALAGLSLCVGAASSVTVPILVHVRLPRLVGCLLAGSGLAVSGMILQTVLNNPLASPSIMGIQSGAGLMTALISALFPAAFGLRMPAAFLGAFLVSGLVILLASRTRASRTTIVLAGLAVSQVFSALIDLVVTLVPDALIGYSDFRIGTLSGVTLQSLCLPGLCILAALALTLLCSRQLELLQLGQDLAQTAGLDVRRWMLVFLALASLLAGAVISFAGLIGFVGLIIPHMARHLLAGRYFGRQLTGCLLLGPGLLLAADMVARTVAVPFELPTGIILTLAGGPYFLWLLFHGKGHGA